MLVTDGKNGFGFVPECYLELAKLVSKILCYTAEQRDIVDKLIEARCFEENDLCTRLGWKRRVLRSHIGELKRDKTLTVQRKMSTVDKKKHAVNYLYLDYLQICMLAHKLKYRRCIRAFKGPFIAVLDKVEKEGNLPTLMDPLPNDVKHPLYIGGYQRVKAAPTVLEKPPQSKIAQPVKNEADCIVHAELMDESQLSLDEWERLLVESVDVSHATSDESSAPSLEPMDVSLTCKDEPSMPRREPMDVPLAHSAPSSMPSLDDGSEPDEFDQIVDALDKVAPADMPQL